MGKKKKANGAGATNGSTHGDHAEDVHEPIDGSNDLLEQPAATDGAEPTASATEAADPSESESEQPKKGKRKKVDVVDHPTPQADGQRYLSCPLTPDEIEALRTEREQEDAQIEELQADADAAQETLKKLKRQIETLQNDGMEKSKRIRTGYEMRYVPCQERRVVDDATGKTIVVTYRMDTQEELERRDLRGNELQGSLFAGDDAQV